MIEILQYSSQYEQEWDRLISNSRNGTFLLYRNYMEYHSNKFNDKSYLFLKNGKVEAAIPGNICGTTFYSHSGITYGGLVSTANIRMTDVLEIFELLNIELQKIGIKEVIYKPIPWMYHESPCEEDIYALFVNKAVKMGCSISSAIYKNKILEFSKLRERGIKKSIRAGVDLKESDNYLEFWEILTKNLNGKYNTEPTHGLDDILYLKNKFPDNIKLFVAHHKGKIIAGTVLFYSKNVIHVQYIAASEEGKNLGGLDFIFNELIQNHFISQSYFDFGISTELMGNVLNENLVFQKEGFGARGMVYETYKYTISKNDWNMIHKTADVRAKSIGKGTTIWQYCVVLENAVIGENCNLNYNVFVENDVVIGNNVTIKSGVQVWDGLRIGNDVFIGPNVTFINDLHPRSKDYAFKLYETTINDGASIGANSTILGGINIGEYAMIGAASLVTKNIPDYTLWYGNPATYRANICSCGNKLDDIFRCKKCGLVYELINGQIKKQ